ncbi:MAG: hypothetical protein QHC79_09670 [Pseudosphingobacterium sp.]|nr:hypothetical protein [Pseudosphingobacterium sp.]
MSKIEIKIVASKNEKGFNIKTIFPESLLVTDAVGILQGLRDSIAISVKNEFEKRNASKMRDQQKIIMDLRMGDITD